TCRSRHHSAAEVSITRVPRQTSLGAEVGIILPPKQTSFRCRSGHHFAVAAVGITDTLEKVPVGLIEGTTENSAVVTDLLSRVQDRGFCLHCEKLLCVLDGSRALKKAVRSIFGERALIQRCWLHKLRNIQSYIPKQNHTEVLVKMRKIMGLNKLKDAQKELKALRSWLAGISHDAVTSLDEAGADLLTLHSLGVSGELRKSLSSTNIIESLFSVVRTKLANVKNWKARRGAQTLRWVASAIIQHKKKGMRRLRGVNQRHVLVEALRKKVDENRLYA
ncbi:MAG: transposase, partial [Bacteroidota bacterium]